MSETIAPEPLIRLTPSAEAELRAWLARPEYAGKHLRVYVEEGGCSGMQYALTFDEQRDGDLVSEQAGLRVLVDGFSAQFLRGSTVDYSHALTGGGFRLHIPAARESCGCGKSFHV
ncbi:MAG: iron-sulfur cluster assembly accessory protein [Verrucomicrobiae bacterium]|nr:iron-sulfur cluster assembly accessory protein [Verrucomicrobiae bacterium]MDW8307981.1 iron-sulfur cluster assembly accessory protein [Verrucomicrobiales bacterium]